MFCVLNVLVLNILIIYYFSGVYADMLKINVFTSSDYIYGTFC